MNVDMTMNKHIERTMAALAIAGTMGFAAWAGQAIAHAEPQGMIDTITVTEIDSMMNGLGLDYDYQLPVCVQEDCSDQVGQTGLWLDQDTGDWYLELGEDFTRKVIDDTASYLTDDIGWDAGYEN